MLIPFGARPAAAPPGGMIATADEGDDLEIVAVLHRHVAERRAGHDFQVALDRHLGRLQPELERQVGNADPLRHPPVLAVDADGDGFVLFQGSSRTGLG